MTPKLSICSSITNPAPTKWSWTPCTWGTVPPVSAYIGSWRLYTALSYWCKLEAQQSSVYICRKSKTAHLSNWKAYRLVARDPVYFAMPLAKQCLKSPARSHYDKSSFIAVFDWFLSYNCGTKSVFRCVCALTCGHSTHNASQVIYSLVLNTHAPIPSSTWMPQLHLPFHQGWICPCPCTPLKPISIRSLTRLL